MAKFNAPAKNNSSTFKFKAPTKKNTYSSNNYYTNDNYYTKKEDAANPIIRSLYEGVTNMASNVAKTPALAYGILRKMAPLGIVAGEMLNLPEKSPKALYSNALTRALDDTAQRNSYMTEKWHNKGDNLVSLIKKGDKSEVAEYLAHSVLVNAPQQVATLVATLSGYGGPALMALGGMSASDAYAKGVDKVSAGKALVNAIVNGGAEVITEKFGTVGLTGGLRKELIKKFGKEGAEMTWRAFAKNLSGSVVKAVGGESLEEGAASLIQNASENLTGVDAYSIKQVFDNAIESTIVGGLTAGVTTGPIATMNSYNKTVGKERGYKKAIEKHGGVYKGIDSGEQGGTFGTVKLADGGGVVGTEKQTEARGKSKVIFNDATGTQHTINEEDFTPQRARMKLDPDYANTVEALDEYIGNIDERITFDNERKSNDYQKRIIKITGSKKAAQKLDNILYRVVDFFEDPEVLNRKDKRGNTVLSRLSPEEQDLYIEANKLYNNIRNGIVNPEIDSLLVDVLDDYQSRGNEYIQAGMFEGKKKRKIYVPRTYEVDQQFTEDKSKFANKNKPRFVKEREFRTLAEALATGKKTLRDGLTTNYLNYANKMDDALFTRQMIKRLAHDGILKTQDLAPDGWEPVAPNDQTFTLKNKDTWTSGTLPRLRLFAPPNIAKQLNKVFQDTSLRKNKYTQAIRKINAISKASRLAWGLFHHNAFFNAYWLSTPSAIPNIVESVKNRDMVGLKESVKQFAQRDLPYGGMFAYKNGLKSWEEGDESLRLLVKNGLTLARNQEWDEQLLRRKNIISKMLDKNGASKFVKDKAVDFHKNWVDWLFHNLGAGLKAQTAMIMLQNEIKRNPGANVNDLAKIVGKNVNDNFGGLNLKRMDRNPTLQYIWQMFTFAPDWTESNARLFAKAVKSGNKAEQSFYRGVVARIVTKGLIATGLLSLLAAATATDDDRDRERKLNLLEGFSKNYTDAWRDGRLGWMKVNVTPFLKQFGLNPKDNYYFSPMAFFLDPTKWVTRGIQKNQTGPQAIEDLIDPGRVGVSLAKSAYYKSSVVPQMVIDAVKGTDYTFKRRFNTISDMWEKNRLADWKNKKDDPGFDPSRVPAYGLYEAKKFLPIPANSIMDYYLGGAEGFETSMRLLGIDVHQGYSKEYSKYKKIKDKNKKKTSSNTKYRFKAPKR